MSFGNAVSQREEMLAEYGRMLKNETSPARIEDIEASIAIIKDEIVELKKGRSLFGRSKPLRQTHTIIEPDRENPTGQKVTVINPPSTQNAASDSTSQPTKRLGNSLRDSLKPKLGSATENVLKAKIEAAKAAKK